MDVDAGERRADRRRRGRHEARAGHPVVRKLPELHLVREPEAAAASNVIHISGIRSHGPAEPDSSGRPWLPQHEWRDLVRRLVRKPTP